MTRSDLSSHGETGSVPRGDGAGAGPGRHEHVDPVDDVEPRVRALCVRARDALRANELTKAETLASMALRDAVHIGSLRLEEQPRYLLALAARRSGKHARARALYLSCIELNRALGHSGVEESRSYDLAFVELRLGGVEPARELLGAAQERTFLGEDHSFAPYLCVGEAAMASATKDHVRAARMIGLSDAAFAAIRETPGLDCARELADARKAALATLGIVNFMQEYEAGAALIDSLGLLTDRPAHRR